MQEVIIYSALLFVGMIVGLFVAKTAFSNNKSSEQQTSKAEKERVMLAQLRQQILAAQDSLQQIEAQSAQLQNQMTEFDYILTTYENQEEQPKITFFGEHASPYLRIQDKAKRDKSNTESQPRDFSNSSSGLFDGNQK
ncbi:MAG: Uncharacterised protein [Glaciecola sp. HTCC2999]|nr:MAG: Uncharacterised protein [Glaciecola sp. HTCC2999]